MRVMTSKYSMIVAIVLAGFGVRPQAASAADAENCLSCHRYRGLARLNDDGRSIGLYYVDPNYCDRALGPHSRLRCTDCHNRQQVGVIPHQTVSPVNCTNQCHLSSPRNIEVRFSHDSIAGMLEASTHSQKVLDQANTLLGEPLRAGQSRCLLCHDEPKFLWRRESWASHTAPVARCNVCHDEQLPVELPYAYWHVYSRSRPARSHPETVRSCAVCHSNDKVRQAFNMPDAAASYLTSFHGRALQLGSEETAGCLDCHVGPMQNVHLTEHKRDPESPTNPSHLADTCRSPSCHPTAGARMSTAAVHLDLATSRGVEYFIGALFVVLIVFTFGPSVVLQALELVQIIIGRCDPRHHRRQRLAERMMADPAGRMALQRFTPHQRVQHWFLMMCFTTLVLTGFPIKFADRPWARWLVELFGGLTAVRIIHHWVGLTLLLGLVYHLVYVGLFVRRESRAKGRSMLRVFLELPMVMNLRDAKELGHLLLYLLFLRRTRPDADRFSAEEKFEYFGVFWGTVLLGMTGLLMWFNAWTTEHLTGRVLTIAMLVHTFEAFLALLHVGIIHMVGVIFSPPVFPLSPAMFTGNTPAEEYAEVHSGMLERVARQQGIAIDEKEEVHHG
jgi:cytochrome b subunit of formate dehydrogenase